MGVAWDGAMKILEVCFHAFGPFTEKALDLSGGEQGFHLVVGPNEAGKSSALRGLKQALFGIPERSSDGFLHPAQKLRIGLLLQNHLGQKTRVLRRKGRTGTLLDAQGNPCEGALEPLLQGLDERVFAQRFAIDHAELVEGGRAIVQGKGELGEILFQAAGGVRDLVDARRALTEAIEELYKPRAARPIINARRAELEHERRLLLERTLPASRWVEHDEKFRNLQGQVAALESKLFALSTTIHRDRRLEEAVPLFRRRRDLLARLAETGDAVVLSEEFCEKRQKLTERAASEKSRQDLARTRIKQLERELEELVVPQEILQRADRLDQLRDALPETRSAWESLPEVRQQHARLEGEIHSTLSFLGRSLDAFDQQEIARLVHALNHKARIKSLGREINKLLLEEEQAREQIHQQEEALLSVKRTLDSLGSVRDPAFLQSALAAARGPGDLAERIREAQVKLERLRGEAELGLKRFPKWSGSLEALAAFPIPGEATILHFERLLGQYEQELVLIEQAVTTASSEEKLAEIEIGRLKLTSGSLPTEADLLESRSRRDTLWSNLRSVWTSSVPVAPQDSLIGEYEATVEQADSLSDRLRREANRIAEYAAMISRMETARIKRLDAETRARQLAEQRSRFVVEWNALWAKGHIEPGSPGEMRSWLIERASLLLKQEERGKLEVEIESLKQLQLQLCDSLQRQLDATNDPSNGVPESLDALIHRAESVVRKIEVANARREELTTNRQTVELQLRTALSRLGTCTKKLAQCRALWSELVMQLGIPGSATLEEADSALDRVEKLRNLIQQSAEATEKIEFLEARLNRFRTLAAEVMPERQIAAISVESLLDCAAEEIRNLEPARRVAARREAAERALEQEHANRNEAVRALELVQQELDVLCREARVADPLDLPRAEATSSKVREIKRDLANLDERLSSLAGNDSMASFEQSAAEANVDSLPAQIQMLEEERRELERQRGELHESLGHERAILDQMDGQGSAADVAQRIAELESRLALDVEEYARLRVARAVLDDVIETYRREHQGALLERAGALFSRLTLGRFEGLRSQIDDHGRHVLQMIRAGAKQGEEMDTSGLSDGTADQLFLALRLASLERSVVSRSPVPLLLDDVLIQFDDARAAAALDVLAEISAQTQVVLFTHHDHLRVLAEARLPAGTLFVHRLP